MRVLSNFKHWATEWHSGLIRGQNRHLNQKRKTLCWAEKGHERPGKQRLKIMLDMIKSRDLPERCSERGDRPARQTIFLCSRKNMHEQGEIGFAKVQN